MDYSEQYQNDMDEKYEREHIDQFPKIVDKVTTILRLIATIIAGVISISAIIEYYGLPNQVLSLFGNMPDGSGVADGYIVIGKTFAGAFGILASIIIFVMMAILIGFTIVSIVLCIVYFHHQKTYQSGINIAALGKNLMIKIIMNGINIGLLLMMAFNSEHVLYSIVISIIALIGVEVVLIMAYQKRPIA